MDDLINIERSSTVASAREAWLAFASLCGWDIPLAKSPLPSQYFRALGVFVDLRPLPRSTAYIQVCPLRIDGILEMMVAILERNRLPSGLASSLVGRLMFACVAFSGFYGKSMLRSFRRRSYEARANFNPQIRAALGWWCSQLRRAPPRPIPWMVQSRRVVVTYSDGEGSGHVGVAIWSKVLSRPQAGRIKVPDVVRQIWTASRRTPGDEYHDIQEVEGIGPLLALSTWGHILTDALWLHFIDNNGSLSCLVKGGSSVFSTDTLVGMTWQKISKVNACPWFDRVDTKSNPVDGLSRGDFNGNWDIVPLLFPGAEVSAAYRRARRYAPS